MPGDDRGRAELARFLRSRRERIDPAQVGMPAGRRRRSPGLRREEVAVLAGVSPTWYTYLEQGRDIRPSPAVLDSLARVLLLSEDERQYMHQLVFGHRPRARPEKPGRPVLQMLRLLVDCYGQGPHPIYAMDEIGDVLVWNDAAADWYTDFALLPEGHCNMLWWMLTTGEARERLVNWEEDCRDVVARYRAYTALRQANPRIRRFVAELTEASPVFARLWVEHEVHGQTRRPRSFRHPRLGLRTMQLQVLVPTESEDVRVVLHLPPEDSSLD